MIGAAISTLVAYLVMFFGMTIRAQQVFPVPYQWRRIALAAGAAVALTVLGKSLDVPLAAPSCSAPSTRWSCCRSGSTCRSSGGGSAALVSPAR